MSERQRRPKRKAAAAALDAITGVRRRATIEASFDFNGAALPAGVMLSILSFLPTPELVHSASLVNSSWRAASENPVLWSCLSQEIWKKPTKANGGTMTSMKRFLELLHRPQFSSLKSITPPSFIHRTLSSNFWEKMGKACPHLEKLDPALSRFGPYSDDELLLLPNSFPCLKKINIGIWDSRIRITQDGVSKFLKRLGESLEELRIYGTQVCSSETLATLGQACPNLRTFFYQELGSVQISAQAVNDLFKTCSKLEDFRLSVPETDDTSVEVLDGIHLHEYPDIAITLYLHDNPYSH